MRCRHCSSESPGSAGYCVCCGQTLAPASFPDVTPLWSVGEILLNEFVVEAELGSGGLGTVYLVRSRSSDVRWAMKTVRLRDDASRRAFYAEVQTWLDLPYHPHLAACRFFRTIGNREAIFAEYVPGGSLHQWIEQRRLTRLDQLLDVAIQTAWGLHALHVQGVVHQDVKPANVLLTADGLAKLADFGLARAWSESAEPTAIAPRGSSPLVSYQGMTPAFCSPEQAARRPLSPQTDVWSWGLTVLALFAGGVTWLSGLAATEALEQHLRAGPNTSAVLPPKLAEVLRRCFRPDPADRWADLAEVADTLRTLYREHAGMAYPRQEPTSIPRPEVRVVGKRRLTDAGVFWDDPRGWLRKAFLEDGRDPAEMTTPPERPGSRKATAVGDFAVYEEALLIFERLVAAGRTDLEKWLAALYQHMAIARSHLGDWAGTLPLLDRSIAVAERLMERDGVRAIGIDLSVSYAQKASALKELGDYRKSYEWKQRFIALLDGLPRDLYDAKVTQRLASGCSNGASLARQLGLPDEALALYDRAIALREKLVAEDGLAEHSQLLAISYLNKANLLLQLKRFSEALILYDRVLEIRERLVFAEGRRDLAPSLALAYANKANVLKAQDDPRGAVQLCDRAIELYEQSHDEEGRAAVLPALAQALVLKGISLRMLNEPHTAIRALDRAVDLYARLIEQEGQRDLRGAWAAARTVRASVLADSGGRNRARAELHEAIQIFEEEIARTNRADLRRELELSRETLAEIEA